MTEYKPDVKNIKGIVERLYDAYTGNKPDDDTKKRPHAGVEEMTEYKPDVENIKGIVERLYHAYTGNKPDDDTKKRLHAGVEGMIRLNEENKSAFYAVAAVAVLEVTERFGLKSHLGNIVAKYLAQSLIGESGYADNQKNKLDLK